MLRTSLLVLLAVAAGVLPARAQTATPPAGCSVKWDATSQDFIDFNSNHYRLVGGVQMNCNDLQLFADEAEVFSDADRMRASGNVLFVSGTSRIAAERLEFNFKTKTGTFYTASGTANIEDRGVDRSLFGTQEPDAFFWGETIEKLGPRTYRITHGGFTTCVQPTPRWQMVATTVKLTLEKRAVLTNMVMKVKDVPLFYLPGMYYPINKEDRATGFLIPIYGKSTIKGQTLSNAFFWAINRSQDATLFHNYYSKTGQSFGGEYRYVQSAGSSGNFQTSIVREHEATYDQPNGSTNVVDGIDSYTVNGTVLQTLPANLRMTGTANYFSSLVAQQRYQQNIYAATNRTRNFGVNLAGNWGANSISATMDRNETFSNDTDSTVFGSKPRFSYSRGEKRIPGLPVYFGGTADYYTLIRTAKTATASSDLGLNRIDLYPRIRFPYTKLPYLTFNSSFGFRETFWDESQTPVGVRVPEGIHRQYFSMASTITGPVLTRIFNRPASTYAQKLKHVIEPTLTLEHTTAIENYNDIIKLDGTDNVKGNVTSATYGLANRLYAKRENSREILSVSMSQSYYTDEDAAALDRQYQSNPLTSVPAPSHFSPLALQAHVSPTQETDATVRAEYDTRANALRSLATNGGITHGWVNAIVGWSLNKSIPADPKLPIVTASHYLNAATTIRRPGNGWSGSYGFNYDIKGSAFLNQRLIAHYNTQCCGVAIDYQKFNFGTRAGTVGVPKDHRFNLSFTLAGIGTFSDLFGAFGGQQGR